MNGHLRPVDQAMNQERAEKLAIRSLWLKEVKSVAEQYPDSEVPWYLTLSGAEGRDIKLLIDEGLISLTEVGSIEEKDQHKVVAVENSNEAVLQLQKKFVGLRIKEAPFHNLIRGDGIFRWPDGEDEKYCRAHIVNLDLNNPLRGIPDNGDVKFPVLAWIYKLCQIHTKPSRNDWTLCLTLHGEVVLREEVKEKVNRWMKQFLAENLSCEPNFARSCKEFFEEALYEQISDCNELDFTALDRQDQQKVIMVMVPKIITRLVHSEGWRVSTERNLRYGEDGQHAPMVTWIVKFTWNGDATATPDALYKSALRDIFSGAGVVTEQGKIEDHGIYRT